jgi:signal transduction histidine kinase
MYWSMVINFRMLVAVGSFFALLLALVGMLAWRAQKRRPGSRRWAVANLLFALAMPFFVLRPYVGDWFGIVVANSLVVVASILAFEGVRQYRNLATGFRALYACGAITIVAVGYFDYIAYSVNKRAVVMSSFMALVTGSCALALLKRKPVGRWPAVMAGLFWFSAAIDVARAVYMGLAPPLKDMFAPEPVNELLFLGVVLSIGCCSFGWAGLTKDCLGATLRDAESQTAAARRDAAEAKTELESVARRAAEAQAARSEYMAVVSEEIRNPLGGILAAMDLLTETEKADQRECADIVRAEVEKILSVHDNLLDLSTLDAGRLTIASRAFDLRDVVEGVAKQCSQTAARKGIDLVVSYPGSLPHRFLGDDARIRQVLLNLVGNALTVAREGQIEIAAERESQDGSSAKMRISVTRSRTWIAPEEAGSLLVTFHTAPVSALQRYGSVGIALAVSKRLVESMNGHLHLENQLGRGSRIGFTLPLPIEAHETA